MQPITGNFTGDNPKFQIQLAAALTLICLGYLGLVRGDTLLMLYAASAPLFLAIALRAPAIICLIFICVSYFRLHEAYPILEPFRLPLATAALALIGLVWQGAVLRAIKPYWTRELKLFLVFFLIVTLGVPFATNLDVAAEKWLDLWIKIGIMTLATAWLIRTQSDFQWAVRLLIISGLLIAAVAIYNKIYGLSLVEGTRVAIGRIPRELLQDGETKIGGILADPNDLALILLFPLSFAMTQFFSPTRGLDKLLALVATPILGAAVVFTQSRGALIGIVALGAMIIRHHIKSTLVFTMVLLVAASTIFVAMGIQSRQTVTVDPELGQLDESAGSRLHAWQAAIRMAIANPLTGVGISNFVENYWKYTPVWIGHNKAVHSTWFEVLADTGFPGAIVFMALIISAIIVSQRNIARLEANHAPLEMIVTARGIAAALIGICASGTFLSQAFTWPFYVVIALTTALVRYSTVMEPKTKTAIPAPMNQRDN